MWAISDALPLEAARAPIASSCQVSAQSSYAWLSYCDFTDFSPRGGLNSTMDLEEGCFRDIIAIFQKLRRSRDSDDNLSSVP